MIKTTVKKEGFNMPVFHTKTIESILDPVAQQVCLFGIYLFFHKPFILQIVCKYGKVEIRKWFFAGGDIKNVKPQKR